MSQVLPLKTEILSGTVIDNRYIIQSLLGQGGLGRTYLALDTRRFNEACVLKEFAPTGTGYNELEKCRSLFKREAKILYQFEHIQIPRFLACFEADDRLFLVQEFVNGKAYSTLLQERQKQGKTFTEQEVIQWLNNLLPVLQYVHKNNIIHRDISPDNIMLPQGKNLPVLIDFGVGKQIANIKNLESYQPTNFVGKMSLVGKLGYAPREQISLGLCFPCSDIYALGVTAIVLLTGKDPSLLMDRYTFEWKWHLYTNVSKGFASILERMLADVYTNRYQTCEQLLVDLESFVVTLPNSDFKKLNNCQALETSYDCTYSKTKEELSRPDLCSGETLKYSSELAPTIIETFSISPLTSQVRGRENSSYTSNYNFRENNSQSQKSNVPKKLHSSSSQPKNVNRLKHILLNPKFIQSCQEKLAHYIGPISSLIVEDVLHENTNLKPYQFVEIISREIPDFKSANKFIRDLITVVN
ncbi:serine/threonine-protein kinase [Mastigocoleus testarum]|uniref:non-specific serine/threonine protein kinase n=1 Tax=Mastigocoleus testarum BC008 TaxID=371196 RepID=A0A0V7ZC16_9CYAN|nr:serine/threonine-protein kinase [Mastigocoleus testarum]KST62047.1 serine/threonine protein kinase [Mastigocoleus testarum BC008]KST62619.1 serine/threonine protein kinase [Mastigocoleus testarum BC008]